MRVIHEYPECLPGLHRFEPARRKFNGIDTFPYSIHIQPQRKARCNTCQHIRYVMKADQFCIYVE